MIIKTGIIPETAFELFGIPIAWYGILIVTGMALAILLCRLYNGRFGIKFEDILDLAVWVLPISIICARLYYVAFSWDYYSENLQNIFRIKDGGLAIYGGLIGGLITIIICCKIKKKNPLDITDYIVPTVALAQSIGRWGNYINIEAYGYETNFPLKMEIIEAGITKYVHPTFLYESICTLAIFIILSIISRKRKFTGEITYLYIILYGLARFFIEGLRTDSLMLFNVRISQILSLLLFIVFTGILIYKLYKQKQLSKNEEKSQ